MTVRFRSTLTVVILTLMTFVGVEKAGAQTLALRNNLLYDATLTPNIGAELRIDSAWTAGVNIGLNAWDIDKSKNKKWRHLLIAPNVRRYFGHKSDKPADRSLWGISVDSCRKVSYLELPSTAISTWVIPRFPSDFTNPSRTAAFRVTSLPLAGNTVIPGFSPATGASKPRPASPSAMRGLRKTTVTTAVTITEMATASSFSHS